MLFYIAQLCQHEAVYCAGRPLSIGDAFYVIIRGSVKLKAADTLTDDSHFTIMVTDDDSNVLLHGGESIATKGDIFGNADGMNKHYYHMRAL
jgi:hypothetical protein